jgi:hypothetical protein
MQRRAEQSTFNQQVNKALVFHADDFKSLSSVSYAMVKLDLGIHGQGPLLAVPISPKKSEVGEEE